jgi:hypothetical protein
MTEPVKTDANPGSSFEAAGHPKLLIDDDFFVELDRRVAALEKYIAQLRAHGHLPTMRPDQ